jgi:hypothetical protein
MSKRSKQKGRDIPDKLLVILVRCEECGKGHWAPLLRIKQGNWVCLNNGCNAVDSFVYEGRMGVTTERMLLEELKKNEERLRKLTRKAHCNLEQELCWYPTHVDKLLTAHGLFLWTDMQGNFQLKQLDNERPAKKEQVLAYLKDWEQHPRFPGARVVAVLGGALETETGLTQ